jgi:hypothetical protein
VLQRHPSHAPEVSAATAPPACSTIGSSSITAIATWLSRW